MDQSFRNLLILISGVSLLVLSVVMDAILVDTAIIGQVLLICGLLATLSGALSLIHI